MMDLSEFSISNSLGSTNYARGYEPNYHFRIAALLELMALSGPVPNHHPQDFGVKIINGAIESRRNNLSRTIILAS
jgi:hypothetical protein